MKKILIIGASGFVGSHLSRHLLAEGYEVRCLARKPEKVSELKELGCEIIAGDMTDAASLAPALTGVDAVYVSVHTLVPQHSGTSGQGFMDIEMSGLQNIVGGCRSNQVSRVIYVTSLGISAHSKDAWTKGRWKTQQYLLESGLDVTVIQPGMIVGIGGQGFNMVLANARKSLAFVIGNGRSRLRTIAIDDLVYDLTGVLEKQEAFGKCYEVGSDDVLSGDELIDTAAEVAGHPRPRKIHIPLGLLRFAAPLIERLAGSPKGAISGALEGLGEDIIGNPSAIRALLPRPVISYREAVARALKFEKKS